MVDSSKPSASAQKPASKVAKPPVAPAPFDSVDAGADIILRTSDKAEFYVHKFLLSFASPFFKDMFSLPQATSVASRIPVIDITEDAQTFNLILRICYPFSSPPLTNMTDVRRVFEAALKYDIPAVQDVAEVGLATITEKEPLGIFVIGCRTNREDICRSAAISLLQHPLQSLECDELHDLSAYDYHKLTRWHARCCAAASGAVFGRDWFENGDVSAQNNARCSCWIKDPAAGSEWLAPKGLWEYLGRVRETLAACPSSAAVASEQLLGPKDRWNCGRGSCAGKDCQKGRREFVEILGREVDRLVSEVKILRRSCHLLSFCLYSFIIPDSSSKVLCLSEQK
ncbi:hypothetical protein DENSPDRAFT_565089 [Dentipellis sp. KUC8613]|nr:hypothetical protein DENSPDRAFT_565089 [Dentipellis sp. KUC8613]